MRSTHVTPSNLGGAGVHRRRSFFRVGTVRADEGFKTAESLLRSKVPLVKATPGITLRSTTDVPRPTLRRIQESEPRWSFLLI